MTRYRLNNSKKNGHGKAIKMQKTSMLMYNHIKKGSLYWKKKLPEKLLMGSILNRNF